MSLLQCNTGNIISAALRHAKINPIIEVLGLSQSCQYVNHQFVPSIVYWPQCCSTAACMFQFRLESSGCGYGRRQAQCILGVVGFLLFANHKLFCLPNLPISKTIAQYWKRGVLLLTDFFFLMSNKASYSTTLCTTNSVSV